MHTGDENVEGTQTSGCSVECTDSVEMECWVMMLSSFGRKGSEGGICSGVVWDMLCASLVD